MRTSWATAGLGALLCVLAASGWTAPEEADPTFADRVAPFLTRHCTECHSGDEPEGDVSFARIAEGPHTVTASSWRLARRLLVTGEMPPPDEPRPPKSDVDSVTDWIAAAFPRPSAVEPGRVTMRRLNRLEYRNTVRDLCGVSFDAESLFPADDVGYGFDNIGDVLSLPPILMEKYLDAAEFIAAEAVSSEDPDHPAVRRFEAESMESNLNGGITRGWRGLYSAGSVLATVTLPREGEYVVRVRAFGQQAGPDVCSMGIDVDGLREATVDVPAQEANPIVYETRLRLAKGVRRIAVAFLNDYYKPRAKDPAQRDRNLLLDWVEVVGPVDARPRTEAYGRIFVREAGKPSEEPAAAREIVGNLARRAFRRPVTKTEVNRLLRHYRLARAEKEDFHGGVRVALQAVLVSPHFLFRAELDPVGSAIRDLNAHELASRLSYFLWASMPDEELTAAADDGTLRESTVLAAHVRRMLRDPRASSLVPGFVSQWLELRRLDVAAPDPVAFPQFDDELREAMRRETELFVEAVIREGRPVRELLDGDFTFVNERLAAHYRMTGVSGDHFRRVRVEDAARRGLLGHASILTVTSNPTRTSPVKRGKWLLSQVLGSPPKPPPPGVDGFPKDEPGTKRLSFRERMARHRKDPACASCHTRMDPLGIGLENFDAVGSWRVRDGDAPVDARGVLPDGRSFDGPAELRPILLAGDAFVRCLAKKLMTYALGRGLGEADEPAVDRLLDAVGSDPNFEDLALAVTATEAFRRRRPESRSPEER